MSQVSDLYDEAIQKKDEGNLEAAVEKLNECLALDEGYTVAHSALAIYLQKLGKYDDAIKHATRVTELEPTDPFSYTQLSVVCQRCGRIQEAEDAMAKAREIQMGGGR